MADVVSTMGQKSSNKDNLEIIIGAATLGLITLGAVVGTYYLFKAATLAIQSENRPSFSYTSQQEPQYNK